MGLFKKKVNSNDFFPKNFVDIHSHLLPGIDDGASDIDKSIELIERMIQRGFTQFRTTPHVLAEVWENTTEIIKEKESVLKKALVERDLGHIQIHAAAEYMMDGLFVDRLANNDILTIKDQFVLVEMSFFNAPINLDDILFEIQNKGYTPILAHPERYTYYHDDMEKYQKLIDAGCLFQLNLLSLTEHYGKEIQKTAYLLLKKGLFSFVGTDAHHKMHIKIMDNISNTKNRELLDPLFKNNINIFSF